MGEISEQPPCPKDTPPVKHLVVDTGAIISPSGIHNLAENYYAPPGVFGEVKDHRSRVKLETLPFEIIWREPTAEALATVAEEAKKTGDYQSLSVVDMKVIALTYDLLKQFGKGGSGVAAAPNMSVAEVEDSLKEMKIEDASEASNSEDVSGDKPNILSKKGIPEGFCSDADSSDDEGWIKPDNVETALSKMGAIEIEQGMDVGCITTDFALQNVLLSLHLGLVSLTGYRITKIRTYLLRCRACYSTTSIMTKEFCPKCGNKALHKCAVSVDKDGKQVLHINWRRLTNLRGLKYSMTAPKGGKHSVNEKLFEDQRMPHQRCAKNRLDPMDDSPFSMHDVTSRSAMLGMHVLTNQRRPRNPNESRPNTGTKKKNSKK